MSENQEHRSLDNAKLESFISLLTIHQHRFYTYIMSRVPRKSDTDDIMQETTLTMFRKFDEFEEGTDFRAWGFSIARYCIMSFLKKQKSLCLHLSEEAIRAIDSYTKDDTKDNDTRINALKDCVKKLSSSSRHLLFMRYHEDNSAKTIAARIGKSVPYVYKALAKIHEFLLQCVRRTLATETVR